MRQFAACGRARSFSSCRIRALLLGTALTGGFAVAIGAAPAQAACVQSGDAVTCEAGDYDSITVVTTPGNAPIWSLTLEDGVSVTQTGVRFVGANLPGDLPYSYEAGPGTSVTGQFAGLEVLVGDDASIVIHSYDAAGAVNGISARAQDGTVSLYSTTATKTVGSGTSTYAIGADGLKGVYIETENATANASTLGSGFPVAYHVVVGVSDGGTVSILNTGAALSEGEWASPGVGAGIGANGRYGVIIDSAVVRTTGTYLVSPNEISAYDIALGEIVPSVGIHGRSLEGDVSITSDDILTTGDVGLGIFARARAGAVTIDSTKIVTEGDGATGIFVNGALDVHITSAEIATAGDALLEVRDLFNQPRPAVLDGMGLLGAGIQAVSQGGDIVIDSGSITTAGAGAHGISAEAVAGDISLTVGGIATAGAGARAIDATAAGGLDLEVAGAVSAAQDTAIVAHAGTGPIAVRILAGGSVAGATGIELSGGESVTVSNAGTLAGTGGAALDLTGATAATVTNAGVLTGTGGTAALLTTGDDFFTLRTGSNVTGRIEGGAGFDTAILSGTSGTATSGQTVAHFAGFESLEVEGGYWTADGAPRTFEDVSVDAGATLDVRDGAVAADRFLAGGVLAFSGDGNVEYDGAFTGSGSLIKSGNGELFLSGGYALSGTTEVRAGVLRLGGLSPAGVLRIDGGKLDLQSGSYAVSGLRGTGGVLNIGGGTLAVTQASAGTFAGAITGPGGFRLAGGDLTLTGASTYAGPTTVAGGVLRVNGSLLSSVALTGGALAGSGTVAGISAGTGGTVAPGNSIGTLTVGGNIAFGPGSVYEVEVNAAGESDRIVAGGTATLTGGTVEVLAEAGEYDRLTTYSIITAAGGVTGAFDGATSNFAYLSPRLSYADTEVLLTLVRNDLSFANVISGRNPRAAASAVEAASDGDPLFEAALLQTAEGAQQAFTALSGEFHGGLPTALLSQGRYVRDAALARTRHGADGDGVMLWAEAVGGEARFKSADAATLDRDARGAAVGIEATRGGLRVGGMVDYMRSDLSAPTVESDGEITSTYAALYGGLRAGSLSARFGAGYGWHEADTARTIIFPGFSERVAARYDARSGQVFAELGYAVPAGLLTFEPYAAATYASVETDAFAETGGVAALTGKAVSRSVLFTEAGVRLRAEPLAGAFSPHLSVAWGNASGDTEGLADLAFTGSGEAFTVSGAELGENALLLEGGFAWAMTDRASAALSYRGTISDEVTDHAGGISLSLRF